MFDLVLCLKYKTKPKKKKKETENPQITEEVPVTIALMQCKQGSK